LVPAAVMKCPKCRHGMVYQYGEILECERCGATREAISGINQRTKKKIFEEIETVSNSETVS
jgi:DNA-directed RNA polymerase subunit M/transcription elongation factor TFIIS